MSADNQHQPFKRDCAYCKNKELNIDYKDTQSLRKFMTDRGKIRPRRITGVCAQHQNDLSNAIKRARFMALLPYSVPVISGGRDRRK